MTCIVSMTNDVKKSGLNTQAKCEPVIAFVIPCYNEEAALHVTADVLKKKVHQLENLHAVAENSFVIFVDDGSSDEGVTSFSTKPLTMITGLGLFSVFVGIVMLVYTLVSVFLRACRCWLWSMMCSLWILGGFIVLALGITGEYIAKIYMEVKARQRYIVETTL